MDNSHIYYLNNGNRLFKAADHLAYVTYPFLKDNKLITSITENLYSSLISLMTALLHFEAYNRRIEHMPEDFNGKLALLKEHCAKRYSLDENHIKIIQDLHNLMKERKTSIMEFYRNDKFIVYNDSGVKSISIRTLRSYLFISKDFIRKINLIIKNAS